MSVQAIGWALSVKTNSPSSKLVLVTIANYADEQGFCWPSQGLIARQSEQSVDSVQRRLKELIHLGLLDCKIRRRQSSLYQLLMPEIIKKPQIAASSPSRYNASTHKPLKPQNTFLKPQLCGTEPLPSRPVKERKINETQSGKTGKQKPRHGAITKDRLRIWLDANTDEFNAYQIDYKNAHNGITQKTQWGESGSWFSLRGES